jgi:hypothetical protein
MADFCERGNELSVSIKAVTGSVNIGFSRRTLLFELC